MKRSIGTVKLPEPGPGCVMGPKRKAERFRLDYATWRDHLAAPGSGFESAVPETARIVRLDTVSRAVDVAESERRTA